MKLGEILANNIEKERNDLKAAAENRAMKIKERVRCDIKSGNTRITYKVFPEFQELLGQQEELNILREFAEKEDLVFEIIGTYLTDKTFRFQLNKVTS